MEEKAIYITWPFEYWAIRDEVCAYDFMDINWDPNNPCCVRIRMDGNDWPVSVLKTLKTDAEREKFLIDILFKNHPECTLGFRDSIPGYFLYFRVTKKEDE